MKPLRYIILTSSLCVLPLFSAAQERTATLRECVSMALGNNLSVKAGELSVEKAHDLQGTAFDVEKTSLSLSQDPTSGGSPDNGITISQAFDFPTVYAARRKYLKAETAVEQNNLALTRNEVVRSVTSSYYALLHARRTIEILQSQDSVYRKFVTLATAKREAGETSELELINANRVYHANRIEMDKAKEAYQSEKLTFRQLLNTDEEIIPAESSLSVIPQAMPETTVTFDQTPWGKVSEARVNATERSLRLAKQGFMPSFNVGFTSQLLIKGFNPYNIDRDRFEQGDFMGFEVGISIPLFWSGQKAKVKAAKRDLELAEITRQQAAQQTGKAYRDALNEYNRARQELEYNTGESRKQANQKRFL